MPELCEVSLDGPEEKSGEWRRTVFPDANKCIAGSVVGLDGLYS